MKSQMSSAASSISLGSLPEELILAASPQDSASDSTIIYAQPGQKHAYSDPEEPEPPAKRRRIEPPASQSGSSTISAEEQPSTPLIIGTITQVPSGDVDSESSIKSENVEQTPQTPQSTQKPPQRPPTSPKESNKGSKGQPHIIKTSHKMNLKNQKMLFQNPVCFMKWFERLEKFLVQASLGHHISPAKKIAPRPTPHTPTGPGPQTPGAGVPTTGAGAPGAATQQQQTIMLPVASASANGSITLLTPSNLPPASANISSSQYRQQAIQPKKTVREMLDSDRAASTRAGKSPAQTTPSSTAPEPTKGAGVIDLTEEEEGSPGKVALQVPQGIIMQPGIQAPTSTNIRPGTYLLPMTSGQPILLQSIVNQSLMTPQIRGAPGGTTLVYTGPRPAGANTTPGQSIVVPATTPSTTTQQLVTLPTGQTQIRPGLVVKPPQQPTQQQQQTQQAPTKTRQATTRAQKNAAAAASKASAAGALTSIKHPAPLPYQPPQAVQKGTKEMPPKPSLKISRVPQGIVLSWNMVISDVHAQISNYQLYAYQEGSTAANSTLWKRVGEVKALPLPMACTLTQFQEGNKYHFAVRAVDAHSRVGPFSEASSIHLEATTASSS